MQGGNLVSVQGSDPSSCLLADIQVRDTGMHASSPPQVPSAAD